jgi:hypothetical protein
VIMDFFTGDWGAWEHHGAYRYRIPMYGIGRRDFWSKYRIPGVQYHHPPVLCRAKGKERTEDMKIEEGGQKHKMWNSATISCHVGINTQRMLRTRARRLSMQQG